MTPTNPERPSTTARIGLALILGLSFLAVVATPMAAASVSVEVSNCGEPLDGHRQVGGGPGQTYARFECE